MRNRVCIVSITLSHLVTPYQPIGGMEFIDAFDIGDFAHSLSKRTQSASSEDNAGSPFMGPSMM